MSVYLRKLVLFCVAIGTLSQGLAQNINITLAKQNIRLTYNQDVRLSQIFTDAYPYAKYEVYSLGIALINPDKQQLVDSKKADILNRLKQLNTLEANNLVKQLSPLDFVYREAVETNINKIRFFTRSNPLIKKDYTLLLPSRPDHIRLFNSASDESLFIPLKTNYHLQNYLSELPDAKDKKQRKAWIIQANKEFYLAEDIQWKRTLYYLTPGAYVFIGLDNLPKQYSTLNADVAELLTFYMEP